MKAAKQESRLSRWSRRKQQTVEETRNEDLAVEIEQPIPTETELQNQVSENAIEGEAQVAVLSDADMEPVESMTENSDFSKFMSPGVSDELRNLALRKMFHAPIFNIRDGLDEYDEDYTTFEKLGDIVTADMRHQMELEAEQKLQAEAEEMAESEMVTDKPDPEGDAEQSPSIAVEDEISQEAENEFLIDDTAVEEKESSHRIVEKIQQS
jgi:hypothetical protein